VGKKWKSGEVRVGGERRRKEGDERKEERGEKMERDTEQGKSAS
jgi:hypothetical protein